MNGSPKLHLSALVGAALFAVMLPVQAATIRSGSGASPPAAATGIYEIAIVKNDAGQLQRILALVHRYKLWEVHNRGSNGYLRRVAGSSPIRVSPGTYLNLLALTGGTNRDVNTLPLATRCQFYDLAGLDRTGMNCPSNTGLPDLGRQSDADLSPSDICPPPDREMVLTTGPNGQAIITCVTKPATSLPALPGRFVATLFGRPIAVVQTLVPIAPATAGTKPGVVPAVTATRQGVVAFAGFHLLVGWVDPQVAAR